MLPDPDALEGTLVLKPAPFKCQFIPRSKAVEAIIDAEAADAEVHLKAWE